MGRYERVDAENYDPPVGNEYADPSASDRALAAWRAEDTETTTTEETHSA